MNSHTRTVIIAMSLLGMSVPAWAEPGTAVLPDGEEAVSPLPPAEPVVRPPSSATSLTLAECVQHALEHNVDVESAGQEVEVAQEGRRSVRGAFGPRVRVEGNLTRWDKALELSFSPPGMPVAATPMTVRDDLTWGATVTMVQPLTQLWGIYSRYHVEDLGVDVARARQEATLRETAFRVTEAFYRLAQADALLRVSDRSVEQLDAQLTKAQRYYEQQLVGQNDVLRARVALLNARQRRVQAQGNRELANARLATLLGWEPHQVLVPQDTPTQPPPPQSLSAQDVEREALAQRVEMRELDARLGQARAGAQAAWSQLVPQVSALGQYQHNEGSKFSQENAYFIGLTAGWDIWDWGTNYFAARQASARRALAQTARRRMAEAIRLEVQSAVTAAVTAAETLVAAAATVEQAEENYRVVASRYEAQVGTLFDVIDAEALLTQARAGYDSAVFDDLIARANVRRATGAAPETVAEGRQP